MKDRFFLSLLFIYQTTNKQLKLNLSGITIEVFIENPCDFGSL